MSLELVKRVEDARQRFNQGLLTLDEFVGVVNVARAEEGYPPVHPVKVGNEVFLKGVGDSQSGADYLPPGVMSAVTTIGCPFCDETWAPNVLQKTIDEHMAIQHGKRGDR